MKDTSTLHQLHMFLVLAVAGPDSDRRPGARHALVLFGSATEIARAQAGVLAAAATAGWREIEIRKRATIASGVRAIVDPALSVAARRAMEEGVGILVYENEIPAET